MVNTCAAWYRSEQQALQCKAICCYSVCSEQHIVHPRIVQHATSCRQTLPFDKTADE